MDYTIIEIGKIVVIAGVCYWANTKNPVPILKTVIEIGIVLVSVILVLKFI